jgi:hypothetical protein
MSRILQLAAALALLLCASLVPAGAIPYPPYCGCDWCPSYTQGGGATCWNRQLPGCAVYSPGPSPCQTRCAVYVANYCP